MDNQPAGLVHAGIVAVLSERPNVAKSRQNTQQNYAFRGIDDFYERLQPLMASHGLHILPHRVVEDSLFERESTGKDGSKRTIIHVRQRIEFRVYHAVDGSFVSAETTGEAMDFGGDKASNKAMSSAMKYALMQIFLVPTGEDNDTETASPEAGSARAPRPGKPQRPPASEPKRPPEAAPAPPPAPTDAGQGLPELPTYVPVYGKAAGSGVWAEIGCEAKLGRNQQARIKILQSELKVEDKVWREKLFSGYGKTSSSQLSATEADDWIGKLDASKRARTQKSAPATT